MKQYNRALDYTVLALAELTAGKPALAARLLATAAKQPDVKRAIAILEASNKHAAALEAKVVTAAEFPFANELDADFDEDPLSEVDEDADYGIEADSDVEDDEEDEGDDDEEDMSLEEAPAETMARVLSSMTRKQRR